MLELLGPEVEMVTVDVAHDASECLCAQLHFAGLLRTWLVSGLVSAEGLIISQLA
jgi:hypothetical protein